MYGCTRKVFLVHINTYCTNHCHIRYDLLVCHKSKRLELFIYQTGFIKQVDLNMAFYPLEQLVNLEDGYQKSYKVQGKDILLCQVEGEVFALENRCPHMDVPLDRATQLPGKQIRCNAHGIEFDLISGSALGPLAGTLCGLTKFELVYEGAQIGVEL